MFAAVQWDGWSYTRDRIYSLSFSMRWLNNLQLIFWLLFYVPSHCWLLTRQLSSWRYVGGSASAIFGPFYFTQLVLCVWWCKTSSEMKHWLFLSLCYAAGDCSKEEWCGGLREAKCGAGAPIPIAFGRSFTEKLKSKVPHF
jgi:hypothetical protein